MEWLDERGFKKKIKMPKLISTYTITTCQKTHG